MPNIPCYVFASVWPCLKMCSENMVLMRLLQIGAKDLTVLGVLLKYVLLYYWISLWTVLYQVLLVYLSLKKNYNWLLIRYKCDECVTMSAPGLTMNDHMLEAGRRVFGLLRGQGGEGGYWRRGARKTNSGENMWIEGM